MGLGKAFSRYYVIVALFSFSGAARPVEHSSTPPNRVRFTITDIDSSTGLVRFKTEDETCAPGQILEASTALGTLDLVVIGREDREVRAFARALGLLSLFQVGDVVEAGIQAPDDAAQSPPDILELLDELGSLHTHVDELIDESTGGDLIYAWRGSESRSRRWHGDAGIRVGYDRYSRSAEVITDMDPNDRASVEQGLADLEELIRRAREVPGIDQSELDRAEELAEEARGILQDPAGDLEQAVADIIAAQIIVEAAVEQAGRDPDAIRVRDFAGDLEDTLEGYAFVNLRRDFPWGETGDLYLDEHLEGGSRFVNQDFRFQAERELADWVRMRFESDTGLRLYRGDFADDVFVQGADLELETSLARNLELGLGGEYLYRREFNTDSDDGFQFGAPRTRVGYRFGRWGRLETRFERQWRRYNASVNTDLDYRQDVVGISYGYFGPRGMATLLWERTTRDADRPLDEDDYSEDELSVYLSRGLTRELAMGIEGRLAERDYVTTGPVDPSTGMQRGEDNTDFLRWSLRPFLETRWTHHLSTTLDYEYARLENEDRVPEDDIDKSLGDFEQHRVGFSVQWNFGERWEVFFRQDLETRNYLNGETGTLQPWFADFRNLADCQVLTFSTLTVYHVSADLDAELDFFHARERYPSFDQLDTDQSSVQVILRYLF